MVKRGDNAVFDTFMTAMNEEFEPGVFDLGLAEAGVGAAMDEYNADLVSADMMSSLAGFEAAITAGDLVVQNFTDEGFSFEGSCVN